MAGPENQSRSYVRLTGPAVQDLQRLLAKDPQIVRTALKKMLLLERDPEAGEPLLGSLVGWRKLVVGDNHWRVVWKVTTDDAGDVTVTISEVWAAGARSEAEIYTEMTARLASAGEGGTSALGEVIALLGRHADRDDLQATAEPVADPVPDWLRTRLVHTAGVPSREVDGLSGEEAMRLWEQYLAGSRGL